MSDFDIPRLTIPQLCYYARFDKFKKSRSTPRFARVIVVCFCKDLKNYVKAKCFKFELSISKITTLFADLYGTPRLKSVLIKASYFVL